MSTFISCFRCSDRSNQEMMAGKNHNYGISIPTHLPRLSAIQIMEIIIVIALSIILSFNVSIAQSEDQLYELHGGLFDVNFSISANLLHELGAPLGSTGQIAACSYPSPISAATNPAGWAFQKKRLIAFEFIPGIKTDLSRYYDVQSEVVSAVDNSIVDFRQPTSEITYPNLIPRTGLAGGLAHARLAIPVSGRLKSWTFAFQITQSGLIDFQTSGNGLSALMETEKQVGDEEKSIKLRMNSNLGARLNTSFFNLSFDAACRIARSWAVGISLRRYYIAIDGKGELLVDGIIQTAGTEYVFNDPFDRRIDFNAGEQNTLDQRFVANFHGGNWGLVLGANWFPANWIQLGLAVDAKPTIVLTGDMEFRFNRIPALVLDSENGGDAEAEFIDPTKLNLAKPTLTKRSYNKTTNQVEINLPSVVHLGARFGRSKANIGINYSLYLGQISFGIFDRDYGIHPQHGLGIETMLGFFRLGLGAVFARNFVQDQDSSVSYSNSVIVPMTSVILDFGGRNNIYLGSSVIISPLPTIGLTVAYTF